MSKGTSPSQSHTFMEMTGEIQAAEEHSAADKLMGGQQTKPESPLDRDCKTPSRLAFRAREGADFMTGLSRLDASQPHRLATLGTRKNSDLRAAV